MSVFRKIFWLLLSLAGVLVLPLLGGLYRYHGSFPSVFFNYPITYGHQKPPYNWTAFALIGSGALFLAVLYLFPWLFGFKKIQRISKENTFKVPFPKWFWCGWLFFIGVTTVMWGHLPAPRVITHYGSTIFYWSFLLIIDGLVYKRKGGSSLISRNVKLIFGLALSSGIGWLIYAYLNFFLDENWWYPYGNLITGTEFYTYLLLASSALTPLIVVSYELFLTLPVLGNRFRNGPKVSFSTTVKVVLLLFSLALNFFIGVFPHQLFFFVWLGPLLTLSIVMVMLKIWTPFRSIAKKGNWTPVLLICLAAMFQGTLWEGYNYLSAKHEENVIVKTTRVKAQPREFIAFVDGKRIIIHPDSISYEVRDTVVYPIMTHRPDYWVYNVPYVNRFFVFEMPVLGLFGYLPYGLYAWIFWLLLAWLTNMPSKLISDDEE